MVKKFQIILADPPWNFVGNVALNAKVGGKEITSHYSLMTDDDIKNLPIKDLTDKDCILFLWCVYSKLDTALEVIKSWGFRYITVGFEWLKLTETGKHVCFMSKWTTGGAIEICLLAKKGAPKRKSKTTRKLIVAKRREHSRKPDEIKPRIVELMGDLPRLELFSRESERCKDGWINLGNHIDGKDIRDGLKELIESD